MNKAKTVAWISLGIAAVGASVAHFLPPSTGTGLLRAASDAALAGGLADLYAITALFRHPLGLKIPHTAILPQSRKELAQAAKGLVLDDWLSKEALLDKLRSVDVVSGVLNVIRANQSNLLSATMSAIKRIVSNIDIAVLADQLALPVRSIILDTDIELLTRQALQWAVRNGYHERLLDVALSEAIPAMRTASAQEVAENLLRDIVSGLQQSPKLAKFSMFLTPLLGMLDFAAISQQILFALTEQIEQMRFEPSNPYRERLLGMLERLPLHPERFSSPIKSLIQEWMEGDWLPIGLAKILVQIQADLLSDIALTDESKVRGLAHRMLEEELNRLQTDEDRRAGLDLWLRNQLVSIIDQNHVMLGVLVEESMEKLSDELLVETIEEKVGHHLQWIRVNGAIVGGLVGIAIYALSSALG